MYRFTFIIMAITTTLIGETNGEVAKAKGQSKLEMLLTSGR